MNNIELKTNGKIQTKEGREFTRLMGGFGEEKTCISTKQIAELMDYDNATVNRTINRNIEHFIESVDIIDLKVAMPDWQNEIGYTKNAFNASKNIYILSQAGFLLYLKFAEGDNAVDLYKNFIEDYFQTKAENLILKKTIDEEIEELKRQKALFLGMGIMETDTMKQVELFREMESVNTRINKLEKVLTQKQTLKELEPQLHIAKLVGEAKGYYDMGDFSKILGVDKLGRNNMFKYLRERKILMSDNVPYQQYVKYFKVIPTVAGNGFKSNKTLLRPNGVEYIVKKLIDDGRVVTRSIDEIIKELEQSA